MRLFSQLALAALAMLGGGGTMAMAEDVIFSQALSPCMKHSQFSADHFRFSLNMDSKNISYAISGVTTIDTYVDFEITVFAYGFKAYTQKINPCQNGWEQLCPMAAGKVPEMRAIVPLDAKTLSAIPSIAFDIPDLDGRAQIIVRDSESKEQLACVETVLSNGKTVEHKAAGWVTAVVAVIGVITAVILVASGHGRSQAASHVATYALSFLGYLQAQAIVGLVSVHMPPLPQGWTQNFQWSMGIMNVGWMQDVFSWYIEASGGKETDILDRSQRVSILVQKRSLDAQIGELTHHLVRRANNLVRRSAVESEGILTLRGFDRVAYKSEIERSNLFLTGLTFFLIFVCVITLATVAFKYATDFAAKKKFIPENKFIRFRERWTHFLKGALFQMLLIGFPQMSIMCLWEFTRKDSPGALMLGIFYFFAIFLSLAWAAFNIIKDSGIFSSKPSAGKTISDVSSTSPIRNSAKISNKWKLLCITFRKERYFFIAPLLFYMFLKAIFVAVAQNSGNVQAVALLILELFYLGLAIWLRPWMDKHTQITNTTISVVNLLNAVLLFVFSDLFTVPPLVRGVFGVIFFILNGITTLVLLIMVMWSTGKLIKNKDKLGTPGSSARSSLTTIPGSETPVNGAALDGTTGSVELKEGVDVKTAEAGGAPAVVSNYRGTTSRASTVRTLNRHSSDLSQHGQQQPPSRTSTRASQRARHWESQSSNEPLPGPLVAGAAAAGGAGLMSHSNASAASYKVPFNPQEQAAIERAWSRASSREQHHAAAAVAAPYRAGSPAYSHHSNSNQQYQAYSPSPTPAPLPPSNYPYSSPHQNSSQHTFTHPERIPLPRNDSYQGSQRSARSGHGYQGYSQQVQGSYGQGGGQGWQQSPTQEWIDEAEREEEDTRRPGGQQGVQQGGQGVPGAAY